MKLSIDEAIQFCKEKSKNIKLKAEPQVFVEIAEKLEELQQYKAIGTIDEFKDLKEKSVAKKVNIEQWIDTKCSCGYVFSKHHGDGYHSIPYENKTEHCPRCGQKLDWE